MAKTLAQGRKPGSGRKPGKAKTLAEGRKPGSGRKKGSVSKTLADGRKAGSGRKKGSVKKVGELANAANQATVQIFPPLNSKDGLSKSEAILLQAANNQYHTLDGLPYTQPQTYNLAETSSSQQSDVQRIATGDEANQYAVQALQQDPANATVQVRYSDLQKLLQQNNRYENQRFILSLDPTSSGQLPPINPPVLQPLQPSQDQVPQSQEHQKLAGQ